MKKQSLFLWFVAFVCAALIFVGCPQEADDDDPVLSGTAALDTGAGSAVVKGVDVDFSVSTGDGAAIGSATTGTVTVTTAALSGTGNTAFTAANSGTVKAVKVASNSGSYTEADFNAATAYADANVITAGDVFFVKVTSQDGKAVKWYKVTVLEDVKAAYSLKASEASNAGPNGSGLNIASATKDGTGKVTIKLDGTVLAAYTSTTINYGVSTDGASWDSNWWGSSTDFDSAPGTYVAVYINGLFPAGTANPKNGAANKVLAVRQTNQALRFYTGGGNLLDSKPNKPVVADQSNSKTIWIPPATTTTEAPVRWRLYGKEATQGIIKEGDTFGLLIWNGTLTPKTAELEIAGYSAFSADATLTDNTTRTFVVDYSGVNFGSGTSPSLILSVPTWSNSSTPNAASVNEMLTRLWSAQAATVQNITQGNVFKYAPGTKTLTVNKANVTDDLKTWITTQWGGTTVPVKVTLKSGTPSGSAADANWSGAYLIWIDVASVVANESAAISLTGGGSESYKIAVTGGGGS